ncbi:Hypothetical protein HDN1F_37520 [gamma proteobacterium HdN1]|nr:Hypothetical protein HDN1F_37520 [gamma proteobacterium HdN1]
MCGHGTPCPYGGILNKCCASSLCSFSRLNCRVHTIYMRTLNRGSIRLAGYDYSRPGAYFITICVQGRKNIFGCLQHGSVQLSVLGEIAAEEWRRTSKQRSGVILDEWVVMPDHFHAIVILNGQNIRMFRQPPSDEKFGQPVAGSIPTIIRSFKSAVTRRVNCQRGTPGGIVWQRGYWERVIRDHDELQYTRQYIQHNPTVP